MTEFETRLSEFREDFRKAALNGFIPYTVTPEPENSSYVATMRFHLNCDGVSMSISITVAKTFVCYHNQIFENLFRNDIPRLLDMIDNYFKVDEDKWNRIKQLEKELKELKEAV